MKILLLGSSSGNEEFYKELVLFLEAQGTVSSPIDTNAFQGTLQERYERAFRLVKETDLIIAEQSKPSTGMGMELREAAIKEKPLIVITKDENAVSGLVKASPNIKKLILYQNLNDLKEQLHEAITFIRP